MTYYRYTNDDWSQKKEDIMLLYNKKGFFPKIALDADDVILDCISYALRLANAEYNFNPPITIDEINQWGYTGKRTDVIFEYFQKPEFFINQPVIEGAVSFVQKLSKLAEVFITTAIKPSFAGIRAEKLVKEFRISEDHIIMGSRKDLLNIDVMWDDNPMNVLNTSATYPVIRRRPWNHNITGLLAVDTFDEFIQLIIEIKMAYDQPYFVTNNTPHILCLIGPSGSGKTELAQRLTEYGNFQKLISYTTKQPVNHGNLYRYVSVDEFMRMKNLGIFFESSVYAKAQYGTRIEDVMSIMNADKHAVFVTDISGAIAMKARFKNCVSVFVKRDKEKILHSLLEQDYPNEEKINRILSLDAELKNEEICNYTVDNNGSIDNSVEQILQLFK